MKYSLAISLKNIMTARNLGITEVSKGTGMRQPLLHRILTGENPNPTLTTLAIFTKFLNITISQLLGEDPLPESVNKDISKKLDNWFTVPFIDEKFITHDDMELEKNASGQIMVDHQLSDKAFAFQYTQTNMLPSIPQNSTVVVDPKVIPLHNDLVLIKDKKNILIKYYIYSDLVNARRKNSDIVTTRGIKKKVSNVVLLTMDNFDRIEVFPDSDAVLGTVVRVMYGRKA